jgi:hypothetical protein
MRHPKSALFAFSVLLVGRPPPLGHVSPGVLRRSLPQMPLLSLAVLRSSGGLQASGAAWAAVRPLQLLSLLTRPSQTCARLSSRFAFACASDAKLLLIVL